MNKTRQLSIISFLLVLALSACSTTGTRLYNVSDVSGHGNYRSILVVGITEKEEIRRQLEDAFVEPLSTRGVNAIASLDIMSAATEVNKSNIEQALADKAVEAVLVIKVVKLEESEFMKEPVGTRSWEQGGIDRGMRYFTSHDDFFPVNPTPNTEGLTTTSKVVTMKVGVYDLETDRLAWGADSQSRDPKTAENVINELTPIVISGLGENGLIPDTQ